MGLFAGLWIIGANPATLLTGAGVAGVIIGFALQDSLSNFASGMMILFYRPYDVGDVVELNGMAGKVEQMSLVLGGKTSGVLAIADLEPLRRLLLAPEVTKVLHSCGEDLEVFFHRFGAFPHPVFDTQIAATVLGVTPVKMSNVGLDYLALEQYGPTLSAGEAQRIRLASQLGSGLCGVLYVLDEPTIGLHPRDNRRLIRALGKLRDLGNTLLIVEHDREVIESADAVLDFGPGAGQRGGQIVAQGTPAQITRRRERYRAPLTARYPALRCTLLATERGNG